MTYPLRVPHVEQELFTLLEHLSSPVASHDKLYHIMYGVHLAQEGFELTLVVISTDCIGSCKSNYHTITTTTAPSSGINTITLFQSLWFQS
jgi:hypothetical protein